MVSCAGFLDACEAFDTVNHEILLQKLRRFGFREHFHVLLASLLDGMAQVVGLS